MNISDQSFQTFPNMLFFPNSFFFNANYKWDHLYLRGYISCYVIYSITVICNYVIVIYIYIYIVPLNSLSVVIRRVQCCLRITWVQFILWAACQTTVLKSVRSSQSVLCKWLQWEIWPLQGECCHRLVWPRHHFLFVLNCCFAWKQNICNADLFLYFFSFPHSINKPVSYLKSDHWFMEKEWERYIFKCNIYQKHTHTHSSTWIYACVCVCVYIYIYIYIYIYTLPLKSLVSVRFLMFLRESLLLIKAVFIRSKIQKKQ